MANSKPGKKPDPDPDPDPEPRGRQGSAKLDWATEWFRGRKCHSTTSPTWATTLSGSNLRPPRPATTECVTPVRGVVLVALSVDGEGAAVPVRARQSRARRSLTAMGLQQAVMAAQEGVRCCEAFFCVRRGLDDPNYGDGDGDSLIYTHVRVGSVEKVHRPGGREELLFLAVLTLRETMALARCNRSEDVGA